MTSYTAILMSLSNFFDILIYFSDVYSVSILDLFSSLFELPRNLSSTSVLSKLQFMVGLFVFFQSLDQYSYPIEQIVARFKNKEFFRLCKKG